MNSGKNRQSTVWDANGVLPPIVKDPANGIEVRSPYLWGIETVAEQFATSPERLRIFMGLLAFRAGLYSAGITKGVQWIDGSFTEDIELIENRPPNDIDVVSFLYVPPDSIPRMILPGSIDLKAHADIKAHFHVDNYYVTLGAPFDEGSVKAVAYWNGLWSHRRNRQWKGYVSVALDADADDALKLKLESMEEAGIHGQ